MIIARASYKMVGSEMELMALTADLRFPEFHQCKIGLM